jgi:hypothetical protein
MAQISTKVVQIMTIGSRSWSMLLKIEIKFPLNNRSLLWPIDPNLGVWV